MWASGDSQDVEDLEMEDVAGWVGTEWGQGDKGIMDKGDKMDQNYKESAARCPSYQQCGEAGSRDTDRSIPSLRVDANWFVLRHFAFAKTPRQLKCHCKFATAILCVSFAPFNASLSLSLSLCMSPSHP